MAVRIFKPYEDEKPASIANSPGNRLEPEYKERYDERGVAYLEQVGEVDTYAKIQSYRDECDVMSILSRYAAGDTSVLSNPGWYIDTTKMPNSYTDYLNLMNEQREKFEQLPLEIRMKFNNNFNEYMATAGEESWMKNMGIMPKKDAAAQQPDTAESTKKEK